MPRPTILPDPMALRLDAIGIDGDVVVRQVDAKQWELREPVTYQGAQETFTVPTGFRTDFASIPRLHATRLSPSSIGAPSTSATAPPTA